MPSADFCPAVRPPFDSLSRRSDAEQISWGKFSRLLCTAAESTLRTLDGYGLRGKLPARPALTPCIRFFVHRLAHLIHASFRPRLAAVALASSLGLHLHQVGRRTCTSKLLNMPSTQQSRWRGGRFAWRLFSFSPVPTTCPFKPVWTRIVAPRLVRLAGQPPAVTRDHWHVLVSR